jgi:hypothetical protein
MTLANKNLEFVSVTPKVVLDKAWLLCTQPPCKVSCQVIFTKPTVVRLFV